LISSAIVRCVQSFCSQNTLGYHRKFQKIKLAVYLAAHCLHMFCCFHLQSSPKCPSLYHVVNFQLVSRLNFHIHFLWTFSWFFWIAFFTLHFISTYHLRHYLRMDCEFWQNRTGNHNVFFCIPNGSWHWKTFIWLVISLSFGSHAWVMSQVALFFCYLSQVLPDWFRHP
jgi:hypothetical protein